MYAIRFVLVGLIIIGVDSVGNAQEISAQSEDGVTKVTLDGRPLLVSQDESNPTKVYVKQWHTPSGIQILRDSPHDHVHHHALMYAIGIEDVDFWAEVPPEKYGKQVVRSQSVSSSRGVGELAEFSIKQSVDWMAPSGQRMACEKRVVTGHSGVIPQASLLTWRATLSPVDSDQQFKLWGRHYFGLGMRFVESMDEGSEFSFPGDATEKVVRGTERVTKAPWCAMHGTANGKPVTVAMFDDPTVGSRRATWFTMNAPFAYVAATLNLDEEPMEVTGGQPLKVRYGVVAWDGTVESGTIAAAYQAWLKLK